MLNFIKKLLVGNSVNFKALQSDGAIIVDVRTAAEYRAAHLAGSKNIPLDKLRASIASLKKFNKPVITVCQSGARSKMAQGILAYAGINAYDGGGWKSLQKKL
jgi:rhodanese-related sulfurtransferase